MRRFLSVNDTKDPIKLADHAINLKKHPMIFDELGLRKTLGMVFFNSSLRTRMSTAKAAYNLGMHVISLNVGQDSWSLESAIGEVMDGGKAEHIHEAAAVMGQYCDILGIRSFPSLQDREADYKDDLMHTFARLSGIPVISLESSTLHPLQSLADLVTIKEFQKTEKPKIVLTWAPHVKALPQSVANSFSEWMIAAGYDYTVVQPEGFELHESYVKGANVSYNQKEALEGADFVYVKNWSAYQEYGKVSSDRSWIMTLDKLKLTNNAKLMHCLPVRRNLVISDDALDSDHSVVIQQAANRVCAAQAVLKEILNEIVAL